MKGSMMEIELIGSNLKCPNCEGEYLHQEQVEAYWREEDSKHLTSSRSTADRLEKDIGNRNPSPRRDGVLIRFRCETCSADPELAIYQHKGNTVVEWYSVRQPINGKV